MSKAIKDAVNIFAGNSFSFVLTFIVSILTARYLGPAGKGLLSSIIFIPTLMISFGELGIRQSIVYYLGRNIILPKQVISTSYILITLLAFPILLLTFLIYNTYYEGFFSISSQILAALTIPITLWTKVASGILLGQGKINNYNKISWLPSVLNLIGVLIFVIVLKGGLEGALFSSLFAYFIICGYGFILTIQNNNFSLFSASIKTAIQLLSKGVLFALSLFIIQLNYKLDIIILKNLVDITDIGIYSLGVNLAEILWQIPTAVGIIILSRTAIKREDINQKYKVAHALRVSLIIMIIVSLGAILVIPYVVPLIYGKEYVDSIGVSQILLIGVVVFTFFKIINSRLTGLGKPLVTIMLFLPCLFIKIICNFWFVPKWGIIGAAWASNLSYIVGGILVLFAFSKVDNISIKEIFHFTKKDWMFIYNILKQHNHNIT